MSRTRTALRIVKSHDQRLMPRSRSLLREQTLFRHFSAGGAFAGELRRACFAMLLLSLSVVGCNTASSGDDEHHDHDRPRTTFAESVVEIQRVVSELTSEERLKAPDMWNKHKQSLVDLIRRLPELAADTELKRPMWDRVDAISRELLTILPPDAESPGNVAPLDVDRIAKLSDELAQVASMSKSLGP